MNWLTTPSAGVPRWILLHLVLVIAATAAGAYAGWIGDPGVLFADLDDIDFDGPLRFMTDLWSSKNIAYLVIIAAALALRAPSALGAILGMKFVNDSLDQLLFTPWHLEGSIGSMALPWLIMTMPMAIASWILFVRPQLQ